VNNIIQEIYAKNSGLLRAKKSIDSVVEKQAKTEVNMVQLYTNDAMLRIINNTQQILTTMYSSDELHKELEILRKLTQFTLVNTAQLRRSITDAVIKVGRYVSECSIIQPFNQK